MRLFSVVTTMLSASSFRLKLSLLLDLGVVGSSSFAASTIARGLGLSSGLNDFPGLSSSFLSEMVLMVVSER